MHVFYFTPFASYLLFNLYIRIRNRNTDLEVLNTDQILTWIHNTGNRYARQHNNLTAFFSLRTTVISLKNVDSTKGSLISFSMFLDPT